VSPPSVMGVADRVALQCGKCKGISGQTATTFVAVFDCLHDIGGTRSGLLRTSGSPWLRMAPGLIVEPFGPMTS